METCHPLSSLQIQNRVSPSRSTAPPPAQNWKSLLAKQTKENAFNLEFVAPVEGKISLSAEEIQEGAKVWNMSLVGYGIRKRPAYLTLLATVKRLWKPKVSLWLYGFILLGLLCSNLWRYLILYFPSWYPNGIMGIGYDDMHY